MYVCMSVTSLHLKCTRFTYPLPHVLSVVKTVTSQETHLSRELTYCVAENSSCYQPSDTLFVVHYQTSRNHAYELETTLLLHDPTQSKGWPPKFIDLQLHCNIDTVFFFLSRNMSRHFVMKAWLFYCQLSIIHQCDDLSSRGEPERAAH